MHEYCLFNGEIKQTSKPIFRINDLAILRGYGIFDFMPIKKSTPLFFGDYWARFSNSAQIIGLKLNFGKEEFEEQLKTLIEVNKVKDGFCRAILTGGYSSNGFTPDKSPNCVVTTLSSFDYSPSDYIEGIKLLTLSYVRENPQVKSLNYSAVLMQQDKLIKSGAKDMLYMNQDEKISESSRANFFILTEGGVLMTPQSDILPGITRKVVLEVAKEKRLSVQVKDFYLSDLKEAKAAFLTSTTKNIMPVTRIDDFEINGGEIPSLIGDLQSGLANKADQYIIAVTSK